MDFITRKQISNVVNHIFPNQDLKRHYKCLQFVHYLSQIGNNNNDDDGDDNNDNGSGGDSSSSSADDNDDEDNSNNNITRMVTLSNQGYTF